MRFRSPVLKVLKWLFIAGLALWLTGVAALFAVGKWYLPTAGKRALAARLSELTGRQALVKGFSYRFTDGFIIEDLEVPGLFSAEKVRINLLFAGLLKGDLVFEGMEIQRPVLRLERDSKGRWNFPETGLAGESGILLLGVQIEEGRLVFRDQFLGETPFEAEAEDIRFDLKTGLDLLVKFSGRAGFEGVPVGPLQFKGEYNLMNGLWHVDGSFRLGRIQEVLKFPYCLDEVREMAASLVSDEFSGEVRLEGDPDRAAAQISLVGPGISLTEDDRNLEARARLTLGFRSDREHGFLLPVELALFLDDMRGAFSGVDFEEGKFRTKLLYHPERILVQFAHLDFPGLEVQGKGVITVGEQLLLEMQTEMKGGLEKLWKRVLRNSALNLPEKGRLEGKVFSTVKIAGPVSGPDLYGRVSFQGVSFRNGRNPPVFSGFSGELSFKNRNVSLERMAGVCWSTVPVSLSGDLGLKGANANARLAGSFANLEVEMMGSRSGDLLSLDQGILRSGDTSLTIRGQHILGNDTVTWSTEGALDLAELAEFPSLAQQPWTSLVRPSGEVTLPGEGEWNLADSSASFASMEVGMMRAQLFGMIVEKARCTALLRKGTLHLEDLDGLVCEGTFAGRGAVSILPVPGPWSGELSLSGVNLALACRAFGLDKDVFEGVLSSEASISSPEPGLDRAKGHADILITEASLLNVGVLGGILNVFTQLVPGTEGGVFSRIEGRLNLEGGKYCTENLYLSDHIFHLKVVGCLGLDRLLNMDIHMVLVKDEEHVESLVGMLFEMGASVLGKKMIRIEVRGTLDDYEVKIPALTTVEKIKKLFKKQE